MDSQLVILIKMDEVAAYSFRERLNGYHEIADLVEEEHVKLYDEVIEKF